MQNYLSIESAWFDLCHKCNEEGYSYTIDRGSFEGCQRKQLDGIAFRILPGGTIVTTYKGFWLTNESQIHKYFLEYLMAGELKENEEYSYGNRISSHINYVIDTLKDCPGTNQATIEVGKPEDIYLKDPPCLRVVSFKIVEGKLNLSCYFRSWDSFQGLPTNLGGLTLLKQYVASEVNVDEGDLICFSDGLHIYPHLTKGYF